MSRPLDVLARPWAVPALRELVEGPLRFNQLKHALAGPLEVSSKSLIATLRALQGIGAVGCDVQSRQHISYRLTQLGEMYLVHVDAILAMDIREQASRGRSRK